MSSRTASLKPPVRSHVALSRRAIGRDGLDLRAAVWAALFLAMVWAAAAEGAVWTTFTSANGLPESGVRAIALTDSQTVLAATQNSVVEYDGIRFQRILARYATPPTFGFSTCVAAAPNGDIWVGTVNGAFQLRANDFIQHTRDDGLGDRRVNFVMSLWIDDDGTVWAGTNNGGLSTYDGTTWSTYTKSANGLQSDVVSDMERDANGNLWMTHLATGGGLSRFDGATFSNFQRPGGIGRNLLGGLTIARNGRIWTCSSSTGVGIFDDSGNWLADYGSTNGLVTDFTNDAFEGAHGDVWIATSNQGLQRWVGGKWEHYPASSGLADNSVPEILVSDAGVLWAATAGGLSRYEGALWLALDGTNLLPGNDVTVLSVDESVAVPDTTPGYRGVAYVGVVFNPPVGQLRNEALRITGNLVEYVFAPSDTVAPIHAMDAFPGGVWIGGLVRNSTLPAPSGVLEQTPVILRVIGTQEVRRETLLVAKAEIGALLSENDTSVWAGVSVLTGIDSPLYQLRGSQWIPIGVPGFTAPSVTVLARDPTGKLLAASEASSQLLRYDPGTQLYEILDANNGIPGASITALLTASDGDIWIGTSGGVARLRGNSVLRVYTTADGIPTNNVGALSEDPRGRIWVGTEAGLAYFDGSSWTSYGTSDGLAGAVVTAVSAGADQTLIATDINGLSLFQADATPPRAVVTSGPPPALGSRLAQMAFGGGDLDSPPDFLRFSWSLDGGTANAFSDEKSANLFGLADGLHAFEVWTRDRALNVTPTAARYEFEVDATPPQPVISSPSFGSVVAGELAIEGTVDDLRFEVFQVAIREVGDPGAWTPITDDTAPPAAGAPLATWDTGTVPDGRWEIRVTVRDTLDLVGVVYVETIVDNLEPKNDVTSPARVVNQTGGRIFSLHGEMEVYFPPQSLDQDRVIVIEPQAGPTNPPPGASRYLGSWLVQPDGFEVKKPVTITFAMGSLDSLSKAAGGEGFGTAQAPTLPFPGVFEMRPDSTLHLLGGSVNAANGTLTTTSTRLGPLAVYEGLFASAATNGRNVDIQPRAFSPTGSTFDDRAAISFDLAGPENVRVLVYDRLGRIVRRVHEGSLGPGRNVVYWDGRDGNGDVAPSGVYLVAIDAEGEVETKSVAVVNR